MALEIKKLSYGLGAEVAGLDLRKPLDQDTVDTLRQAWAEHLVLVLRDQDISPAEQIRYSRYFGDVEGYPNKALRHPDYPEIFLLANKKPDGTAADTREVGRGWHTDLAYTATPAMGSILRCIKTPSVGGTTAFANMYMAYDTLSEGYRKLIDPLFAVTETLVKNSPEQLAALGPEKVKATQKQFPPVVHPMVRINPITKRKSLFLGELNVTRIAGFSHQESKGILDYLFSHMQRMEFTYRHAWKPNDILMWDNAHTQHMAVQDNTHVEERLMHRTTILGTVSGEYLTADERKWVFPEMSVAAE